MAAIPISIEQKPEQLLVGAEQAPCSTQTVMALGALAAPRDSRDEFLQPTKKWSVTGAVPPGEIGSGCQLKCLYCNQRSFDVSDENEKLAGYIGINNDGGISLNTKLMVDHRIERYITPQDLLAELDAHPLYDRNGWLLLENYNDPGTSWRQTCKLIEGLLESGHNGPMTFITKMGLPEKYAAKLHELREQGAKLTGIISYAGLPETIEPAPVEARLTTLRRLKEAGIPTIVSVRPLIEGINLDDESIARVLAETHEYTDFYIAGGLFVFDEWTPEAFADAGHPLNSQYLSANYDIAKVAPSALDQVVQRIAREHGLEVTVMPHTTCAIAAIMTTMYNAPHFDRLSHWVSHDKPGTVFDTHCRSCPIEQRLVCGTAAARSHAEVMEMARGALDKIGYPDAEVIVSSEQPGYLLVKDLSLTFGEQMLIRERTGLYVNNLPRFEGLVYRTYETMTENLQASFFDSFAGAVQAGEEWYIFIKGDLDGKQNKTSLRYIRSRNRARIQLLSVDDLHDEVGYAAAKDRLFAAGLDGTAASKALQEVLGRDRDAHAGTVYKQHLADILQRMGRQL